MNDRVKIHGLLSVVALLSSGAAVAEPSFGADVSVEGGYASNPFAVATGNAGTALATVTFAPVVGIESPTSQFALSGRVSHVEYARLYDSNTNYFADASFTKSLSPVSRFGLQAGYSRVTSNAFTGISDPALGDPGNDPTLFEIVGREIETIRGNATFATSLSPRDSLNLQASAYSLRNQDAGLLGNDLDSYSGTAGYSHAFSESLSLGVSGSATRTDFKDSLLDRATVISPSLTAELRITPRIRLSANAGASFSDLKQGNLSIRQTNFSGSAELCHQGERLTLCATARRTVAATSVQGLTNTTGIGATGSYKLSPRSTIAARFDHSRNNAIGSGGPTNLGYYSTSVRYSREMSRRLILTAESGYASFDRSAINGNSNFTAKVGVTYRLGRTQ